MDLLPAIELIAREAGIAIMSFYHQQRSIVEKEDGSPLTDADTAAHHFIVSALKTLAPSIHILSEESVPDFSEPNKDGFYWLVDPLDGTKEFISCNGEFTVNIALIENGHPILGVVYAPALNVIYSARKGFGSYKQNDGSMRKRIGEIHREFGKRNIKIVSSRSHADEKLQVWLKKFESYETITMGSSLKFCLVAEGLADVYPRFGPTCFWDTAAAQCVVEEAGGSVLDLNGFSLTYHLNKPYLNPSFIAFGDQEKRMLFFS